MHSIVESYCNKVYNLVIVTLSIVCMQKEMI